MLAHHIKNYVSQGAFVAQFLERICESSRTLKSSSNGSPRHPKRDYYRFFEEGEEKNLQIFSSPSSKNLGKGGSHARKIRDDSYMRSEQENEKKCYSSWLSL
jgi:hypothetical protein